MFEILAEITGNIGAGLGCLGAGVGVGPAGHGPDRA